MRCTAAQCETNKHNFKLIVGGTCGFAGRTEAAGGHDYYLLDSLNPGEADTPARLCSLSDKGSAQQGLAVTMANPGGTKSTRTIIRRVTTLTSDNKKQAIRPRYDFSLEPKV